MSADKEIAKTLADLPKLYEHQDVNTGLKLASKISRKYPENAEIMAWYAMFLQSKKQHKEADDMISKALRMDMKNPRIWKLCGLINKEEKKYTKATQCLAQSYKMDSSDSSVLTELCGLYLFERNYPQFLETSHASAISSPTATNVVRYGLALDLSGQLDACRDFFSSYISKFMPTDAEEEFLFRSDLCNYYSDLLIRMKKYSDCLSFLDSYPYGRDQATILERRISAYIGLGDKANAVEAVHKLLQIYPENGDYFKLLESILTPDEYMKELFLAKTVYRSSYAHVRILELMPMADPLFQTMLSEHILKLLTKGSPAVFQTVKEMSREKLELALKIAREATLPISSIPIVHIFAANFYSHIKDYSSAIEELKKAKSHTPTCIEASVDLAKALLKAGRIDEAVKAGAELYDMDPADRNSSHIYVRCLLMKGDNTEALKIAQKFSIDPKQKTKLFKTEFNTFYIKLGDCARRCGDKETALMVYESIPNHFSDYRKGEFNYLSWGMRRAMSLREVLLWSDKLNNHATLGKAATRIFRMKISEGEFEQCKDLALRVIGNEYAPVMPYVAVILAKTKEYLSCIKAFRKVQNHHKFTAYKAVDQAIASIEAVDIVKEVVREEYEPFKGTAQTFKEKVSATRGMALVGDKDGAKALLRSLAADAKLYKEAKTLCEIAKFEMKDEALSEEVKQTVLKGHPEFQFLAVGYVKPAEPLIKQSI